MIQDLKPLPSPKDYVLAASKVTGTDPMLILSSSRKAFLVMVRTACIAICKSELGMTDEDLGTAFNRERSSITHAMKRHHWLMARSKFYNNLINKILNQTSYE